MDEIKAKIKETVLVLFPKAGTDTATLDVVIAEALDRVLLYLNYPTNYDFKKWNNRLNPVIARVIVGIYTKTTEEKDTGLAERGVASLSDNGQNISYKDTAKQYLATATDEEVFAGFTSLLARYRRPHVLSKAR